MMVELDEIKERYKSGSTTWGFSEVFQAVSDIHGLIMMVEALTKENESLKEAKK